jgi:hypothetical protein
MADAVAAAAGQLERVRAKHFLQIAKLARRAAKFKRVRRAIGMGMAADRNAR